MRAMTLLTVEIDYPRLAVAMALAFWAGYLLMRLTDTIAGILPW